MVSDVIFKQKVSRESRVVLGAIVTYLCVIAFLEQLGCCKMEIIADLFGVCAVSVKQMDQIFAEVSKEYPEIKKLCDEFDEKLTLETSKLGEEYEYITALAYRQAIAAHKLVEDTEGRDLR